MPKTKDEQPREPMRIGAAILIVALLAASTWASVSAEAYRWVDEDGVTSYTQVPPPSGESVELRMPREPSTDAVDAAHTRLRQEREQDFDQLEARKEARAAQKKQAAQEVKHAENCAAAQKNLTGLRNLGPRRIRTPDGRYLRLTPDLVQAEIERAQGQVATFCR